VPRAWPAALVRAAVGLCADDGAVVLDAGFALGLLQEEGATRYVVRLANNATLRRATPPPYRGRGRPPTRGALVRPSRKRPLPATPPHGEATWEEDGIALRAQVWTDLVPSTAGRGTLPLTVVAVFDPRQREPLLLASPLPIAPRAVRELYRDRWPVEQLPLVAKQLLGAGRQFVHAPRTCQRLPVLALLAGAVLAYAAASAPPIATGFWDRRPQPTAGRLRRALEGRPCPTDLALPARLRAKRAPTAHLPTGFWGQRHSRATPPADVA
jgi:hypothetical protein